MKRYEFRAVRSGKQEAIIGLFFAAILMFPIPAIQLALFYSGLDKTLKSNPSPLITFEFVFVVCSIVYASFYLIRRTQEKLVKDYVTELNAANIRILENGKEIMTGPVSDCEIINKIEGSQIKAVSIIIYTDTDKIAFRLRGMEWKSIMGSSDINPLGTSDAKDMKTALELGKDIKNILEKYVSANY